MATSIITKFVQQQLAKKSAKRQGIATLNKANDPIVQANVRSIEIQLKNMGIDPTKLTSTEQLVKYLNIHKSLMDQSLKQQFKGLGLGKGIKSLEKKDPFQGFTPRVQQDVDSIIKNLKSMEPVAAMKEANLVIGRKGNYKHLSNDEAQRILKETDDHIFQRDIKYDEFGDPIKPDPEDLASGGIAGELHLHRPGYDKGKLVKVYRGQSVPINPFKKRSSSLYNRFGRTRVGRYATTSAAEAANYATKKFPNVIKKTKITPDELKVGKRVYHELEPHYTDDGVKIKRVRKTLKDVTGNLDRNYNILSKKNKAKLKVDILKTIASNAKALTPLAAKGLNFLASLPVATLAMVFHSTPANSDEVNMKLEDFAKLAEKQNMAEGGIAGPLHLYGGGRIGLKDGKKPKFPLSRRTFLGGILGTLAWPFLRGFEKKAATKTAAPVVKEAFTRGADGIPNYAWDLINVVKAKGTKEIMEGFARKTPVQKKYTYKGVEVVEDGTGGVSVRKEQTKTGHWSDPEADDVLIDEYVDREIGFEIREGEDIVKQGGKGDDAGKVIKTDPEYNESTAYMQGEPEGGMDVSEIIENISDADHLELKAIADESLIKKASGGRVSYTKGGLAHVLGV